MPAPSNQIKVTFIIILPFNLVYICDFILLHIEMEGKDGWIIEGPKGKGMLPPPSNFWGPAPTPGPPPPPPPLFLRLCETFSH